MDSGILIERYMYGAKAPCMFLKCVHETGADRLLRQNFNPASMVLRRYVPEVIYLLEKYMFKMKSF